jgi:hypothetical protein
MPTSAFVWWAEPAYAQVFYAFLAVVCLVTLVRVALLAWTLLGWPVRGPISVGEVAGPADPDQLAASALAGTVRSNGNREATPIGSDDGWARLMRRADAIFTYRWQIAHARVTATKGLSGLTVLVSVAEVAVGAYPTFFEALWESNLPVHRSLLVAFSLLMTRLMIGLAVGIVSGAAAMFFNGCLIRRHASWRLFQATVADAWPKAR